MNITHKFSGHLNSNLFIRTNGKISVTELWSRYLVPIVNQQFPAANLNIRLNELLHLGALYVDQKRMRTEFEVDAENVLRIHLMPRRFDISVFDYERDVIFQNSDFMIVNKPALLPVHPTLDNFTENLLSCLQEKTKTPVFSVHRLDIETTGLIIFAKNELAMAYFQKLFSNREIKKIYKAVVRGSGPTPGFYRHWMLKDPRSPKKISTHEQANHVAIELNVLSRGAFSPGTSIVEIELLTGKTHQIRSQMAHLGFPLIADTMYGGGPFASEITYSHFLLHAYQLEFTDSQGNHKSFTRQPSWIKG